ncbi:hypothetical protein [Micromonospora sp. NPDC047740]
MTTETTEGQPVVEQLIERLWGFVEVDLPRLSERQYNRERS